GVGVDEPGLPTLYEWAGGGDAVRRFIDAFYDRVEQDELLSPFFPGGVSEAHRSHVAAWWSEVLGGPTAYTDELGGYEAMPAHPRGSSAAGRRGGGAGRGRVRPGGRPGGSGRGWWGTWGGPPAWRCTTHGRARPASPSTRRSPAGAGASPRRTRAEPRAPTRY